jgi:hypothetical protein
LAITNAIPAAKFLAQEDALGFCISLIDFMAFVDGYGYTDKGPREECLLLSVMLETEDEQGIWFSAFKKGECILSLTKLSDELDLKTISKKVS